MKPVGARCGRSDQARQPGHHRETCPPGLPAMLMALFLFAAMPTPGWAAQDAAALLAEGVRLLQREQTQAALLVLEHAAFLEPENPAIRQAYAQALAALGAVELARKVLPSERNGLAPQQQLELAMVYSTNRRQEPSLSGLSLTIPGAPPTYYPLSTPLSASPGPMLAVGYSRLLPLGTQLHLRLKAAPDETLGNLDIQTQTPLGAGAAWKLKFDYQKNLASGAQAGAFLSRAMRLAPHWTAELEAGLRQENTSQVQRTIEWRAGISVDSARGHWLLAYQRAYPWASSAAGGQKRWILGWFDSLPWASGRLHAALYGRDSRDTESYHPLIESGAPRRQTSVIAQLRYEFPKTGQSGWYVHLGHEKHHSNLEIFRYKRSEISLGWQRAW